MLGGNFGSSRTTMIILTVNLLYYCTGAIFIGKVPISDWLDISTPRFDCQKLWDPPDSKVETINSKLDC